MIYVMTSAGNLGFKPCFLKKVLVFDMYSNAVSLVILGHTSWILVIISCSFSWADKPFGIAPVGIGIACCCETVASCCILCLGGKMLGGGMEKSKVFSGTGPAAWAGLCWINLDVLDEDGTEDTSAPSSGAFDF